MKTAHILLLYVNGSYFLVYSLLFVQYIFFYIIETYSALLKKAHHDTAKLPIICTPITGPTGEMVFRIDDIIGEVRVLSLVLLFLSFLI